MPPKYVHTMISDDSDAAKVMQMRYNVRLRLGFASASAAPPFDFGKLSGDDECPNRRVYMVATALSGQFCQEVSRNKFTSGFIYQELFFNMYGVLAVIITATVLSLLGVTAVCLRFYVRVRLTKTFVGLDDWLIAFSCLLVLGQCACQITCTSPKSLTRKYDHIWLKLIVILAPAGIIGDLGRDGKPAIPWRSAHQAQVIFTLINPAHLPNESI